MDTATIRSKDLTVNFMLPRLPRPSQRFDAGGVVNEVTLRGRHSFCEPEQRIPGRETTWGLGLCGEFVTPGIAPETPPGGQFPKFGVGLLTQRPEGGEHNVWQPYECEPFAVSAEAKEEEIRFVQEPKECRGYGLRTSRQYRVEDNRLILTVTAENVGSKPVFLQEYQHNFVSIDHLPVGRGYRLDLPFVRDMGAFADCCRVLGSQESCAPFLESRENSLLWTASAEGRFWFRVLEAKDIRPCREAYWTLSHTDSPAAVSESCSFVPLRAVLWGISHCVCTELYFGQEIGPGRKAVWQRTWTFSEET